MIAAFTRRRKQKGAQTSAPARIELALPVIQGNAIEAKLRSEIRFCGTCSYEIHNPMTDRCPRCFSHVALSEHTDCGECSHQGNCTYNNGG